MHILDALLSPRLGAKRLADRKISKWYMHSMMSAAYGPAANASFCCWHVRDNESIHRLPHAPAIPHSTMSTCGCAFGADCPPRQQAAACCSISNSPGSSGAQLRSCCRSRKLSSYRPSSLSTWPLRSSVSIGIGIAYSLARHHP